MTNLTFVDLNGTNTSLVRNFSHWFDKDAKLQTISLIASLGVSVVRISIHAAVVECTTTWSIIISENIIILHIIIIMHHDGLHLTSGNFLQSPHSVQK